MRLSMHSRGSRTPTRGSRRGLIAVLAAGALAAAGLAAAPIASAATATWTNLSPATSPPAREYAALAYDEARDQLVLFGGEPVSGSYLADTWTWDGTTWTQQSPTTSPSTRFGMGMAYDAAIGKVVLFGGLTPEGATNSTWTWDGTNWAQITTETSPSARFNTAMVYDQTLQTVVLFGGQGNGGALGDTWTFDGTTWTEESPTTSPSGRAEGAMAYDSTAGHTVLASGYSNGTYFDDTWTYDGTAWTQLTPTTPAPARAFPTMADDPDVGGLVLYGGMSDSSFMGDTWTFAGGEWAAMTPSTSPSARIGAVMAYYPTAGQLILFGGASSGMSTHYADTWSYALPTVNPPAAPAAPIAVPGNAQVALSWTAPADGGAAITEYQVEHRATGSTGAWSSETITAPTTTDTVTGLLNGTSYDFRVRAVNSQGPGDYSPVTSATPSTVPAAPAMPTLTPDNTQVLVSWTAPYTGGSPITGYTVAYRPSDGHKWRTVTSTDTSTTVADLTNNVQYMFKVLATNANGNSPYSPERATTPYAANAPGVPAGVAAVSQPSSDGRSLEVALTWTDSGNAATDHEVTIYAYRMSNKGVASYRVVGTVLTGSGDSTYTVTGLSLHKTYAFSVAAGNADGWSVPSTPSDSVGG